MKNLFLVLAIAVSIISCNKKEEKKDNVAKPVTTEKVNVAPNDKAESLKTAYVDTSELMKDYQEAKDVENKYKAKATVMEKKLDGEVAKFKTDAAAFQKNAQANGQEWAQKNGQALQQREQQLQGSSQQMMQQLQEQSGAEMDKIVKEVKQFIKDYGKQNGYSYIYGTGSPATVLYAEDKYDITKEITELLNAKYKVRAKK